MDGHGPGPEPLHLFREEFGVLARRQGDHTIPLRVGCDHLKSVSPDGPGGTENGDMLQGVPVGIGFQ